MDTQKKNIEKLKKKLKQDLGMDDKKAQKVISRLQKRGKINQNGEYTTRKTPSNIFDFFIDLFKSILIFFK